MDGGGLWLRQTFDRWGGVLLAACLLAAGVGGLVAYDAHATQETDRQVRTVTDGRLQAAYDHNATITEAAAGTPFEVGATTDERTVYFRRLMPVLRGAVTVTYGGAERPVEVRVRRLVVVESVGDGGPDGEDTVYWRLNRSVATVERTLAPGESVRVPFAVNVTAAQGTGATVAERVGSPGEVRIRVLTRVVATKAGEETASRRFEAALPVETDGDVYRVSGEPRTETFSRTVTERTTVRPGPLRALGGPALLLAGLVGAGGLGVLSTREDLSLSATERAWLAYRDDRAEFAAWIHTVTVPAAAVEDPDGEAATLSDLVDFAIDADEAVVEDPRRRAYVVFHRDRTVVYEAPERPAAASERVAPALDDADAAASEDTEAANGDEDSDDGQDAEG